MSQTIFSKPERSISAVFLHCSASDHAHHDSIDVINQWHVERGFSGIGYHFFINKNGTIHKGRSIESAPAAQRNHNTGSIAICLHGLRVELFTQAQFESLISLCKTINENYSGIRFRGHCEVSNKACPVFNYKAVLGLDDEGHMTGPTSTKVVSPILPHKTEPSLSTLSIGGDVFKLQRFLNQSGFNTTVDGLFGQQTRASLTSFIAAIGLTVNTQSKAVAHDFIKYLKLGHKGQAVKITQSKLIDAGLTIKADGHFGQKTFAQIKVFQQLNRLQNDGVVGPKTFKHLFKTAS